MTQVQQPVADVISPAEAQFWQQWAAKAPALLQKEAQNNCDIPIRRFSMAKIGGVGAGVILTGASCTKYVPGYWKILSGAGAVVSGVAGVLAGVMQSRIQYSKDDVLAVAHDLAIPERNRQLADYLSKNVTGADIQRVGIEKAVLMYTMGHVMGIPLDVLRVPGPAEALAMAKQYNPAAKNTGRSVA